MVGLVHRKMTGETEQNLGYEPALCVANKEKPMSIVNATPETFDNLTSSGKVLVDFWAPWCGPCRMMERSIEEVERRQLAPTIVKVDIEAFPGLANDHKIMSIPTMVLMDGGKEVWRKIGVCKPEEIMKACGIE